MSKVKTNSLHGKSNAAVAKKVPSKVEKKKVGIFSNAPEEHYFVLCNGQQVKNVKELADALEVLDDDVFNHHVTFDRNDFANWINDIFSDAELAAALAGVKDKKDTRIVMYKHLIKCLGK
jgi:hypothetical protein